MWDYFVNHLIWIPIKQAVFHRKYRKAGNLWLTSIFLKFTIGKHKKSLVDVGVPKMVVPPKHPKMIIFSRKTHG